MMILHEMSWKSISPKKIIVSLELLIKGNKKLILLEL